MANYATHLYGGIAVGITGSLSAVGINYVDPIATPIILLAGIFGGIAPDLDHDAGKPIRILFNWCAVVLPTLLVWRIELLHVDLERILLSWMLLALFIRFPLCFLFKKMTVHRGIFHSVPAIGIFGCILYILMGRSIHDVQIQLAAGITGAGGYLIHLVLDEMASVDFNGVTVRSKRSQWTALALRKKSTLVSMTAYILLLLLGTTTYLDYIGNRPEVLYRSYMLGQTITPLQTARPISGPWHPVKSSKKIENEKVITD